MARENGDGAVTHPVGMSILDPSVNYPRNCWYVAATSDEVGRGLLARTVLGQPVVLYRLASGAVTALEDRCPHRSLPLSYGSLAGDEVVCGYHGMAFAADGRCVRVPSQEHVPYGARATSYAVREEPPFVWIWPGDPGRAELTDPPALPWLPRNSAAPTEQWLPPRNVGMNFALKPFWLCVCSWSLVFE